MSYLRWKGHVQKARTKHACLLSYYSTSLSLLAVSTVCGSREYPEPLTKSQQEHKGLQGRMAPAGPRCHHTTLGFMRSKAAEEQGGLARSPLEERTCKGSEFLSPAASSQHHPQSGNSQTWDKMSTISHRNIEEQQADVKRRNSCLEKGRGKKGRARKYF